jgi:hypothetical protein
MDVDFPIANVLQDAGIGCGLTALIVMFRKSINGDRHATTWQANPLFWDGNYSAGDDQCGDAAAAQFRQNSAEFAVPDQRLSANQRDMQWAMFGHQVEDTGYQRVAA